MSLIIRIRILQPLSCCIGVVLASIGSIAIAQTPSEIITRGVELRDQANVLKSINILRQGLLDNPSNLRMKIELASSYYVNKEYQLAKKLAKEVIDEESIPVTVRDNIGSFLAQLKRAEQRGGGVLSKRRQSLKLFLGHDSNANIAPEDATIDIGELTDSYVERAEIFSGMRYDFSQYKPIALAPEQSGRKPSLYHYNGFSVYNKNYSGFDRSDLLYASGRAGLKYTSADRWYLEAKTSLSYIELDRSSLVDYYRLDLQLGRYYGSTELGFKLASNYKNYHHKKNDKSQGHQIGQSIIVKHVFSSGITVRLSATNSDVSLKDKSYSYDSKEFDALIRARLSNNVSLSLSGRYSKNNYRDIQLHYSDSRKDTVYKQALSLDVDDVYLGVGVALSYTQYNRNSNHDINVYDRNIVLMTLKYPFGT